MELYASWKGQESRVERHFGQSARAVATLKLFMISSLSKNPDHKSYNDEHVRGVQRSISKAQRLAYSDVSSHKVRSMAL